MPLDAPVTTTLRSRNQSNQAMLDSFSVRRRYPGL
jgi:hypothetical protein